jgi:hypothetical protein
MTFTNYTIGTVSADEKSGLSTGVITLRSSKKAIHAISRYLVQVSYSLR